MAHEPGRCLVREPRTRALTIHATSPFPSCCQGKAWVGETLLERGSHEPGRVNIIPVNVFLFTRKTFTNSSKPCFVALERRRGQIKKPVTKNLLFKEIFSVTGLFLGYLLYCGSFFQFALYIFHVLFPLINANNGIELSRPCSNGRFCIFFL